MSGSKSDQTSPQRTDDPHQSHQPGSSAATLTKDQLHRWAQLIADGASGLPNDLPEVDRSRLVTEVRMLLRTRLITTIVEAIAADIERPSPPADPPADLASSRTEAP
jgi:hypothetical protein